jgi:tetratricopeptide (TPR) repeat protein
MIMAHMVPASAQSPKASEPPADQSAPQSRPDKTPSEKSDKPGDKGAPKAATPVPGAPNPRNQAGNAKKPPPAIAVQQPRTPAEREKALSDLYALLATADGETAATSVAASIERMWLNSGSDTVAVLMDRAMQATQAKKPTLALKLLDAVVGLAPDYAEAWNRRAYVHFAENNIQLALGDLRRVLALDPNHFKALDGLAHILKDVDQKKAALAAVRKLLEVHPYWNGAQAMHDELARQVEGQAL